MSQLSPSLPPGLHLPARFELDREIGRGGMAAVYRAHDRHLGRLVAIKVLTAHASDTVGAERFQREVALMARLVHPGIVALFDSGTSAGQLYYVMPLVTGETLRARLVRERRLSPPDVATIGADVAEALAYAHGMHIVHRDIKPENIFIASGRAMLADFGIARDIVSRSASNATLTTAGTVIGTLAYMSPEQASGDSQLDGRADLYSLGCLLYELLSGAPPFVAPTFLGMLTKHLTEAPRPLREHGVDVGAELEACLQQLLAKDPDSRPPSAGDVARVLRSAATPRGSMAVPITPPAPPPTAVTIVVDPVNALSDDAECIELAQSLSQAVGASLVPVANTTVRLRMTPGEHVALGETIVDGTVRRSGRRLRVALRARTADGTLCWTQQVDGSIDDLFTLEDEAAQHVRTFVTGLGTAPGKGSASPRAGVPQSDADHLVAEGLRAFNQFGPTGGAAARAHLDEAMAYLNKALALEPRHARGLCAMGNVLYVSAVNGVGPREELLARGRELIFSALAADDQCAEVHCSLGKIALYHDDDFHSAARHVRRAAELDPSEPEALRLLSIVCKILGQSAESVRAATTATERAPESAPLWNALGDALLAAGRNAEAVDALKSAIRILPGYGPALERMELARARLGEFDLAAELRASRLRLAGQRARAATIDEESTSMGAAVALARDVRRELETLLEKAAHEDPFADYVRRNVADRIVNAYADLGEWAHAMDWVERSYEQRPGRLRRMLADLPVDYRGLAADPRYARLMRVAGMEDMI